MTLNKETLKEKMQSLSPLFTEISDILKEGSYLFYELEDKEKEYVFSVSNEDSQYNKYTKKISPLFLSDVIDSESNSVLLDIIDEEIPFYHIESTREQTPDSVNISSSRDCGVNDIPTPLQESNFYEVWFREAQGTLYNDLILDVYNKLRWPIINENQFLNASLFPTLAQELYSDLADDNSLIEFRNSAAKNKEDNEFQANGGTYQKIGCVDYLNNIINQKLLSMYALVDYTPDQSSLLTDWVNSLIQSGQFLEEEKETQISVYKLQDIKYELLRRKFAGSRTLYNLALASIDRRGSFISTVPIGALSTSDELFKDKRLMRLLNFPGIITEFKEETAISPLDAFYDESDSSSIPLETLISLYYTSADIDISTFDAESFYLNSNKISRLRDNLHVLEWNSLDGLLAGASLKYLYDTLDEKLVSPGAGEGYVFRTLDSTVEEDGKTVKLYLDRKTPLLSTSITFGNMFDLSADKLLYNSNTLQQLLKEDYPYLTYPVADDNSISLIDISWIEYLKNTTEEKSRVQDNVDYGTQINKYQEFSDEQVGEYNFFAISYGNSTVDAENNTYNTTTLPKLSYLEAFKEAGNTKPKFAYLWFCTVKYRTFDFKLPQGFKNVLPIKTALISRITLRVPENKEFEEIDAFKELITYNEGVLPLTYPNLHDDVILGLKLGLENEEVDGITQTVFYDDLAKNGYTKAQFVFATSDLISLTKALHTDPSADTGYITLDPSEKTQAVFFAVRKSLGDNGYNYRWSEPFKVVELTDALIKDIKSKVSNSTIEAIVRPDWYQLVYHLNPYLNFTVNSASTLRHKEVPASYYYKETLKEALDIDENQTLTTTGPSENASLVSLSRSRHMDYTCNDLGEDVTTSVYGMYLERVGASSENIRPEEGTDPEYVSIYGDNRTEDLLDPSDISERERRSAVKYNSETYYPCLEFNLGEGIEFSQDEDKNKLEIVSSDNFSPNYLKLKPCKNPTSEAYENWVWNEHNGGISFCLNFSLPDDKLESEEESKTHAYFRLNKKMNLLSRVGKKITVGTVLSEEDFCSEFELYLEWADMSQAQVVFKYYPYGLNLSAEDTRLTDAIWTLSTPLKRLKEGTFDTSNIRIAAGVDFTDSSYIIPGDSSGIKRDIIMSLIVDNNEVSQTHTFYNLNWTLSPTIPDSEKAPTTSTLATALGINQNNLEKLLQKKFGNLQTVKGEPGKFVFLLGNACKSNSDIDVLSNSSIKNNKISQENMFFGTLYDLRLYNVGNTGIGLRLLNLGLTRELFSYSPSDYILSYNLYRDLGIFKEKILRTSDDTLGEINSIRVFNRSVWDSILVDMFPVSKEESVSSSLQYVEDYFDPKTDTDVWGKVHGEVALSDCIEQSLQDGVEVNNNTFTANQGINLNYRNKTVAISHLDELSLINTSLYPVSYNKEALTSVAVRFELDGNRAYTSKNNINLPATVNPVDGVIEYDADIGLNYTISPVSNFTNWLSKGTHITLSYNPSLEKIMAVYSATDISGSASQADNSQTNHILVPLTVPRQTDLDWDDIGYFDRINLQGIQLSNNLITLLKATSYYNELRIPVAFELHNSSSVGIVQNSFTQYASKWDAIRTLKEGTYYMTCKYPFQILPFEDYLYDINNKAKYNSLYATVRFKIEVRGVPVVYEKGKNGATDISNSYDDKYSSVRLESTLKGTGALFDPEDNRSFPHRNINIDLYVQDINNVAGRMYTPLEGTATESYTYKWRLIGTNHSNDYPSSTEYIQLTRDRLNSGLVLKTDIPLFFSKSYNTSFFIAGTEKDATQVVYNPESADDDLIRPIKLNPRYNAIKVATYIKCASNETAVPGTTYYDSSNTILDPQPEEGSNVGNYYTKVENLDKLEVYKEDDLDNLVLAAGRSYKLLWDYTGKVSELSFTDNIYSLSNDAQQSLSSSSDISYLMSDSEKTNYARLSSLLDTSNTSDYLYDRDGLSYNHNAIELSGTCGYNVVSSEFVSLTEHIIEDVNAIQTFAQANGQKAYRACTTLQDVALNGTDFIFYRYSDGAYTYFQRDDAGKEIEISVNSLKLTDSNAWVLGDYYVYSKIPTVVYKAVVRLPNYIFKLGDHYYRWIEDYYREVTLNLDYDSLATLPTSAGGDVIYGIESTDGSYLYYGNFASQEPFFSDKSTSSLCKPFNFGNPYSRSSKHNYLLAIKEDKYATSRTNIDNSYFFAYTPTEVPEDANLSAEIYIKSLPAFRSINKDITEISSFNEASILKAQHDRISETVLKAIRSFNTKSAGLITALSEFKPHYAYPSVNTSTTKVAENSYVRSLMDTFHAYYASDREVPSKNSTIYITRRGLYSNNLFKDQNFDNSKAWTWKSYNNLSGNIYSTSYTSDDDWDDGLGKDVYEIDYQGVSTDSYDNSRNPIILKYSTGNTVKAATYETALNVKVLSDVADVIYLNGIVINDSIVEVDTPEDRPFYGNTAKIYLCKNTLQAWRYLRGDYEALKLAKYEGSTPDADTLYIDSPTSKLTVSAVYYSGNVEIANTSLKVTGVSQGATSDADSTVTFSNVWYNFAAKSPSVIKADTIAFAFQSTEKLTFRITKAVTRISSTWSHQLGLSDGLYNSSTSDSESRVSLTSHRVVVFKNNETGELLPIQFNAYTNTRNPSYSSLQTAIQYPTSGLSRVGDFIASCSLGFPTASSKLETLYDPNVRRLHYKRQLRTDIVQGYAFSEDGTEESLKFYEEYANNTFLRLIEPISGYTYYDKKNNAYYKYTTKYTRISNDEVTSTPFVQTVTFTRYTTTTDDFGVISKKEASSATKDLYTAADINYVYTDAQTKYLAVNSLTFNDTEGSPLKYYNTNLQLTKETIVKSDGILIASGPIDLSNEKISAITNCFDTVKYRKNLDSVVAITNIQLLGKSSSDTANQSILYELEYPPIIYRENDQHVSYNIMLRKLADTSSSLWS